MSDEFKITRYIENEPPKANKNLVEAVRCGECKYWEESQYYPKFMVCTYVKGATYTRQHDDFCSRGERKDDD